MGAEHQPRKRAGSVKRHNTLRLAIQKTLGVAPTAVTAVSRCKGYRE